VGLRSDSYYTAARERIREARFLHENRYYTLAMYISGLAVECMLRAFRLLNDPTFDERHDLWLLWKSTELANVHGRFYLAKIQTMLNVVVKLWNNDYRFRSETELRAYLKKSGNSRGIKGDILKFNSGEILQASAEIIRLGAGLWISSKAR
jgi:hypothetical protein